MDFRDIQPFVRYVRLQGEDLQRWEKPVCAYDHRLFFCFDGAGGIRIDGVEHPVVPGTVVMVPAGHRYQYLFGGQKTMRLVAVNFDWTAANRHRVIPIPPEEAVTFSEERLLEQANFPATPVLEAPLVQTGMQGLYGDFLRLNQEFTEKRPYYQELCSGLLVSIITLLVRSVNYYVSRSVKRAVLDQVTQYVLEHYNEPLSNETIARHFGYHPNYLNRLFVKGMGLTLHQYLLNHRIMEAIYLLQNSRLSATEIAAKCGFSSVSQFSKIFSRRTGESPSAFRERR